MSCLTNQLSLIFPDLSPYKAFFSNLRNNNSLDHNLTGFAKLRESALDEKQVLKKLQTKTAPLLILKKTQYV